MMFADRDNAWYEEKVFYGHDPLLPLCVPLKDDTDIVGVLG